MDFALFFELIVPRPWTPEREREAFENYVAQAKLADELGFRTIWCVEHHFFEEFSHASAPDLFLLACARETKRLRIGHGIVQCVPEVNSAVRAAERAATLDILSGGRLEFGTGRGATWVELAGYRVNPDETKMSWDEYVRTIPKMWMEERFGYDGTYVKLPRRAVVPKPFQKPHPPIWAAAASPGTEIDCGDRGIGALFLSFSGYSLQRERTRRYREHIAACTEPVGAFINNRATVVNFLFCDEDDTYAQATGKQLAISYGETGGQASSAAELYPTATSHPAADVRAPLRALNPSEADVIGERNEAYSSAQGRSLRDLYKTEEPKVPEGMCAGNPTRIIEAIKGWAETGVDEVGFLLQAGEIISHEQVMQSLRLFGREVMPHFANDRQAAYASAVAAGNGRGS